MLELWGKRFKAGDKLLIKFGKVQLLSERAECGCIEDVCRRLDVDVC